MERIKVEPYWRPREGGPQAEVLLGPDDGKNSAGALPRTHFAGFDSNCKNGFNTDLDSELVVPTFGMSGTCGVRVDADAENTDFEDRSAPPRAPAASSQRCSFARRSQHRPPEGKGPLPPEAQRDLVHPSLAFAAPAMEMSGAESENRRLREEIKAVCATITQQSGYLSQLWAETGSLQAPSLEPLPARQQQAHSVAYSRTGCHGLEDRGLAKVFSADGILQNPAALSSPACVSAGFEGSSGARAAEGAQRCQEKAMQGSLAMLPLDSCAVGDASIPASCHHRGAGRVPLFSPVLTPPPPRRKPASYEEPASGFPHAMYPSDQPIVFATHPGRAGCEQRAPHARSGVAMSLAGGSSSESDMRTPLNLEARCQSMAPAPSPSIVPHPGSIVRHAIHDPKSREFDFCTASPCSLSCLEHLSEPRPALSTGAQRSPPGRSRTQNASSSRDLLASRPVPAWSTRAPPEGRSRGMVQSHASLPPDEREAFWQAEERQVPMPQVLLGLGWTAAREAPPVQSRESLPVPLTASSPSLSLAPGHAVADLNEAADGDAEEGCDDESPREMPAGLLVLGNSGLQTSGSVDDHVSRASPTLAAMTVRNTTIRAKLPSGGRGAALQPLGSTGPSGQSNRWGGRLQHARNDFTDDVDSISGDFTFSDDSATPRQRATAKSVCPSIGYNRVSPTRSDFTGGPAVAKRLPAMGMSSSIGVVKASPSAKRSVTNGTKTATLGSAQASAKSRLKQSSGVSDNVPVQASRKNVQPGPGAADSLSKEKAELEQSNVSSDLADESIDPRQQARRDGASPATDKRTSTSSETSRRSNMGESCRSMDSERRKASTSQVHQPVVPSRKVSTDSGRKGSAASDKPGSPRSLQPIVTAPLETIAADGLSDVLGDASDATSDSENSSGHSPAPNSLAPNPLAPSQAAPSPITASPAAVTQLRSRSGSSKSGSSSSSSSSSSGSGSDSPGVPRKAVTPDRQAAPKASPTTPASRMSGSSMLSDSERSDSDSGSTAGSMPTTSALAASPARRQHRAQTAPAAKAAVSPAALASVASGDGAASRSSSSSSSSDSSKE